eukprot:11695331-Alexandrium_andersonii.AAC.1
MAYHIRVMCSHTRAKLGSYKVRQLVDSDFLKLWDIRLAGTKASAKNKCPFVNFQADTSDSDDTQEVCVDPPTVAATYWDAQLNTAFRVMVDGSMDPAL